MFDIFLSGLINGNAYALVALGLSLVIGVANVVNFAQGSFFSIGAMVGWFVTNTWGLPLWLGVIAAIVVTGAIGYVTNLVAVKPFAGRAPIAAVLATIAVMIILDNLTQLVFGSESRRFDSGLPETRFSLGGISIGVIDIVIVVTVAVLLVVLTFFLKYSAFGLAVRAASQDREAAAQMGVPVNRVQSVAFMISAALGGVAGVLVGVYFTNISPTQGFQVGLAGMAAATLGGLGSLPGAVVGGLALGVLEAFGSAWMGDAFRQVITFGSLLVVLWIRPQGIFGKRAVKKEPLTGTFFSNARPIRLPRWAIPVLIAVGFIPLIPGVGTVYTLQIGIQIFAFAMVALSIVLIGGMAGQLSLGQAGAVAIGAYALAIVTANLGWPFIPSMLFAGLVAAVISVLLAAPSWKLSGHYPAIATLATGALISAVIQVWTPVTGGGKGFSGIPNPEIFGIELSSTWQIYLLGFGLFLLEMLVVVALLRSHLGRFWRAIRDDEVAAQSAGIAVGGYKSLAFGVGAFLAGIAGTYWASQYGYIDGTIFSPNLSFQFIIIAVLGGLQAPFGVIIGVTVLVGGLEIFRVASSARLLIYGLILLLLIRFRPQGLWTRAIGTKKQKDVPAKEGADV